MGRENLTRTMVFAMLLICSDVLILARSIAISYDDAPRAGGQYFTGPERTKALIVQLEKAGVNQALFFAVAQRLEDQPKGTERLNAYVEAGHVIANHSYSHGFMQVMGIDEYIADLVKGDVILSELPGYTKLYRFPYLNEGRNLIHRDMVRAALKKQGLKNGYVTIDNYEWWLEALFQNALKENRENTIENLAGWRDFYVETLVASALFYDGIASQHLQHSPKHMLLLHENDLAALFTADLIDALKREGFKIIDAISAYDDPIAEQEPATLFNGQGRVAAIARVKGVPAAMLIHPSESKEYLSEEAIRRGLIKP